MTNIPALISALRPDELDRLRELGREQQLDHAAVEASPASPVA
jgi:hypothetical protein